VSEEWKAKFQTDVAQDQGKRKNGHYSQENMPNFGFRGQN
jgi:hypothetical protein